MLSGRAVPNGRNIDFWLLVFGVIVVIGVGGESVLGIRHWWNSHKLDAIHETENETPRVEIARLNADAATPKQKQASHRTKSACSCT